LSAASARHPWRTIAFWLVVEQAPQAGTRVQGSTQVTIYVGRLS
jgi:hypothetical protein